MTSKPTEDEAYVWLWLPDATAPVIAGRLWRDGANHVYNYGQNYLGRGDAMPLYLPELPLQPGAIHPDAGLRMAGCLRDAAPDAWGRRVILNKMLGRRGRDADVDAIGELTYLLESGSDRIGALDFQRSPTEYVPRSGPAASIEELLSAAEKVEKGIPLTPELDQALLHGSSLGGARPKAMIVDGEKKYIAKFSSSTDTYNVVKAEFIAMRLAATAGLNVAPVRLIQAAGKDVLLVERFDRVHTDGGGWCRKSMVSALTVLGLDEMMARYAGYIDLANEIRHRFTAPTETLRELFGRLAFNVLCGNTDDHARNHAAFWDGQRLDLTPAYDICPQNRTGGEASQAMLITENDRSSLIATCLQAAPHFLIDEDAAKTVIAEMIDVIRTGWPDICEEAKLSDVDRAVLWERVFLNPYVFEGSQGF